MARPPDLDCTRCGACCTNPDENRREGYVDYIEVDPRAPLRGKPELMKKLTVLGADGVPHMRILADNRCIALRGSAGKRITCAIYEDRPSGCRKILAGDARCLVARRERGLDP